MEIAKGLKHKHDWTGGNKQKAVGDEAQNE